MEMEYLVLEEAVDLLLKQAVQVLQDMQVVLEQQE
jgi:hypothetical protein